jgi:hypothetical protein
MLRCRARGPTTTTTACHVCGGVLTRLRRRSASSGRDMDCALGPATGHEQEHLLGHGIRARRSAARVVVPTTPSRVSPLHPWNATTAFQVRMPKTPSTAPGGRYVSRTSVACSARTAGPRAPSRNSFGACARAGALAALTVASPGAGTASRRPARGLRERRSGDPAHTAHNIKVCAARLGHSANFPRRRTGNHGAVTGQRVRVGRTSSSVARSTDDEAASYRSADRPCYPTRCGRTSQRGGLLMERASHRRRVSGGRREVSWPGSDS